MFQSSRMASGSPRLQTSSAFSPSSASEIWKSSPSRMRRATFRMTLESSPTRHVFILASLLPSNDEPAFPFIPIAPLPVSRRQHVRHDFEHAIDVQHHHQLAVEPVNPRSHLRHPRVEIDRIHLATVVCKL